MHGRSHGLILIGVMACVASPRSAGQRGSLRDLVRERGDVTQVVVTTGPPVGLKDIVQHSSLTIEGVVSHLESALTPNEVDIYTDVVIDVTRVFRTELRAEVSARPGPSSAPSPFVATQGGVAGPGASTARVRLRLPHTGQIQLDGGSATQRGEFPTLHVGEHVITSASLDPDLRAWVPFGIFDVRDDGHVVSVWHVNALHYDSVEAFAAALADPPPTRARQDDSLITKAVQNGGTAGQVIDVCGGVGTVESIVGPSSLIVRGVVRSATPKLSPDETQVVTQYDLAPSNLYKGSLPPHEGPGPQPPIRFTIPYGTLDVDGLHLSTTVNIFPAAEMPRPGEEIMVFLYQDANWQTYALWAGEFGAFRVIDGQVVGLTGAARESRGDKPETLAQFEQRLREALSK